MDKAQFNRTILKKEKLDFKEDDEFGRLVQKTAQLIGRTFPATLKLVEKWEPAYLAVLYDECISKWRNKRFNSPAHMWWTERKKMLSDSKKNHVKQDTRDAGALPVSSKA